MGFYWLSSLKNKNKTNEQKKMMQSSILSEFVVFYQERKEGKRVCFPNIPLLALFNF